MEQEWNGYLTKEASRLAGTRGGLVTPAEVAAAADIARAQALSWVYKAQLHLALSPWDTDSYAKNLLYQVLRTSQAGPADILEWTMLATWDTHEALCPVLLEAAHANRHAMAERLKQVVAKGQAEPTALAAASISLLFSPIGVLPGGTPTPSKLWNGWWQWLEVAITMSMALGVYSNKGEPPPESHLAVVQTINTLLADVDLLHQVKEVAVEVPGVQLPERPAGLNFQIIQQQLDSMAILLLAINITHHSDAQQILDGQAQQVVAALQPP
jgi:hypothetical protein